MYERTILDNGLQVVTVGLPHVQSVSLGFFMNVGSRYESARLSGASHFVEHMLFKGTSRRPSAREIAEAIEGRGGVFNASTGLETSLYWAKVAVPHLSEAMDVLTDMLLCATFDPLEMEKERSVITEEIKYAFDTPDSLAQIRAIELQWPDHPLGREVAGTEESVADLSREALLAYQGEHYHPGRTVLGLAGGVKHAEVVELAETYLADWAPGTPAGFEPSPENHHGPRLRTENKDSAQAHLSFSFSGLSRHDPDRYILRLLNVILGEGMRSRLFQEVRERLGLAYTVDSYVSTLYDTGAVGVYAAVAVDSAQEAIDAVLGQLDRLRQEPVPSDELEKAKEFTKGRLALALEDSFAVASWYAQQVVLSTEVLEPEEVLDKLRAVTAQDIQRVAQTLFRLDRLNLAIVGPFGDEDNGFRGALSF